MPFSRTAEIDAVELAVPGPQRRARDLVSLRIHGLRKVHQKCLIPPLASRRARMPTSRKAAA